MTSQQRAMIHEAQRRYPGTIITPCGDKKDFSECFTKHRDSWHFWFNAGKSTHLLVEKQEQQ